MKELNNLFVNCIQVASNIEQIQQNLECVGQFDDAVKRFAGINPQYDLYTYLGQTYSDFLSNYNSLVAYFQGNSELTEAGAISLYNNGIIALAQIIINLVDELGNCSLSRSARTNFKL